MLKSDKGDTILLVFIVTFSFMTYSLRSFILDNFGGYNSVYSCIILHIFPLSQIS